MKQVHVIATCRSEHLVELEDDEGLDNLVELLQAHSNVKLVGYTAEPLEEAVDAAIDELLEGSRPHTLSPETFTHIG